MRSTFYGLEIAKTGLFTSQTQLDITGHNMSNASTVGYTRQRVVTEALPPGVGTKFIAEDIKATAGRGVSTVIIDQVRNPFLDYQYRKENSAASRLETKEQYFEYVESLFNNELDEMDKSTGLTNIFKGFYSSLYSLTEAPADREIRANVKQNGIKLTETMNYYYNKLVEQQNTLNESVRITVTEINDIASQIADLNRQIFAFENPYEVKSSDGKETFVYKKANANDLRDKRNVLIDQLSGIVSLKATEDKYGRVTIEIGGKKLVDKYEANFLVAKDNKENPIDKVNYPPDKYPDGLPADAKPEAKMYGIYWADANGDPIVVTGDDGNPVLDADGNQVLDELNLDHGDHKDDSGSLRGYLEIRDGLNIAGATNEIDTKVGIPYVIEKLNTVVAKIVKDINEVHQKGWNMPQGTAESVTGKNFFDPNNLIAKNMKLDTLILQQNGEWNIAASDMKIEMDSANSQQGNNKIALELCSLITKTNANGTPDNLNSAYKEMLSAISLELKSIKTTTDTQVLMRAHIDDQRKSISDVSIDEEMTNLVRFNHAYKAASRVITTMDEGLDTIINKMGTVGR